MLLLCLEKSEIGNDYNNVNTTERNVCHGYMTQSVIQMYVCVFLPTVSVLYDNLVLTKAIAEIHEAMTLPSNRARNISSQQSITRVVNKPPVRSKLFARETLK